MNLEADSLASCSGREKVCLVCGDKALGYNFNAVTCESCKAFFRRNALKDKDFKCPFNRECEVNIVTRRFCQLCRLMKCFQVGMKKEYIMSEDDKREKRKKNKQKRASQQCEIGKQNDLCESLDDEILKKRLKMEDLYKTSDKTCETLGGSEHNVSHLSPSLAEPSSPVGAAIIEARTTKNMTESTRSRAVEIYQMIKSNHVQYDYRECDSSTIQNILSADREDSEPVNLTDCRGGGRNLSPPPCHRPKKKMPLLTSLVAGSTYHPQQERDYQLNDAATQDIFNDIPGKHSKLDMKNSIDSILSEAIKLEYEAYSSMNPRINSRELNDAERAKLNELIVANKALLAPLDDYVSSLVSPETSPKVTLGSQPMLVDVLNLTAVAIRRLIKMAKKVNAFKNMCQEDQVALLKGGCTEMMILRSAMTYDSDRGSWKIPHSKESLMNIKVDVLKEAGGKVFEEHQRFLQTFDPRWRQDENIMLILSAITLFTPDRPRVVHYDVIKLEQNSYYYLLRRYLESTYPGCEARSTFLKLIHKIAELHRLNEDHVRVYMELNPQDVEPLLIEIFDLNLH